VLNNSGDIFTESIWNDRGSRVYLKEGFLSQILSIFFGLLITLVTSLLFLSQNLFLKFKRIKLPFDEQNQENTDSFSQNLTEE
jgi:hypothetical protein